jgi:uncharacterized SAM-binding protein YcdF (DUF218 family)
MITRFFALLLMAWILGFAWFGLWLPVPADGPADARAAETKAHTDGVVVLTGGEGRIEQGLAVLSAQHADRMLISGVDRDVRRVELEALYPKQAAQFACCVDLGFKAVDTRSNALETARWVARNKAKSIRLVTSDWHMRRARLELDMLIDPSVTVLEDAVPTNPSMTMLLTEYHKYMLRLLAASAGI